MNVFSSRSVLGLPEETYFDGHRKADGGLEVRAIEGSSFLCLRCKTVTPSHVGMLFKAGARTIRRILVWAGGKVSGRSAT